MIKSASIIALLLLALLFGTLASIHASSSPTDIAQSATLDNAPGPFNPNEPGDAQPARQQG